MVDGNNRSNFKNEAGSTAGIQPHHAETLRILLMQLSSAICSEDMDTPGNNFHPLVGNLKSFYSVKVNKNWRIIFKFDGENAVLVNYVDYH